MKRTFLGISTIYDVDMTVLNLQAVEHGSRVHFNEGDNVSAQFDPAMTWSYSA